MTWKSSTETHESKNPEHQLFNPGWRVESCGAWKTNHKNALLPTPICQALLPTPICQVLAFLKNFLVILMCSLHGEALIRKQIPLTFVLIKHLNYKRGWGMQLLSTKENSEEIMLLLKRKGNLFRHFLLEEIFYLSQMQWEIRRMW